MILRLVVLMLALSIASPAQGDWARDEMIRLTVIKKKVEKRMKYNRALMQRDEALLLRVRGGMETIEKMRREQVGDVEPEPQQEDESNAKGSLQQGRRQAGTEAETSDE